MKIKDNKKVSIIIPTYNEKNNIIPLLAEIEKITKQSQIPHEIIVVDDNSPDKTAIKIINCFGKNKNVKVILRKQERGLATAILTGIKRAEGEIIIGMDADFNHPSSLIPKLIENLDTSDMVVASRFIRGGGMEEKGRYFLTYFFNLFLKYILGFPTRDNLSGFYAIKSNKLFNLNINNIYSGYGEYHLRLVYAAKNTGLIIKEIPVYYKKRKFGSSKTNLFKYFFVYLWTAIKLHF